MFILCKSSALPASWLPDATSNTLQVAGGFEHIAPTDFTWRWVTLVAVPTKRARRWAIQCKGIMLHRQDVPDLKPRMVPAGRAGKSYLGELLPVCCCGLIQLKAAPSVLIGIFPRGSLSFLSKLLVNSQGWWVDLSSNGYKVGFLIGIFLAGVRYWSVASREILQLREEGTWLFRRDKGEVGWYVNYLNVVWLECGMLLGLSLGFCYGVAYLWSCRYASLPLYLNIYE